MSYLQLIKQTLHPNSVMQPGIVDSVTVLFPLSSTTKYIQLQVQSVNSLKYIYSSYDTKVNN